MCVMPHTCVSCCCVKQLPACTGHLNRQYLRCYFIIALCFMFSQLQAFDSIRPR
jgi:hypothetical protein